MIKFIKKIFKRFTKVSMGVLSLAVMLGFMSMGAPAFAAGEVTTNAATDVTSSEATLKGTNGSADASGHSFWVSTSTFITTSSTIPANVYSTVDLGPVTANTSFSAALSSATDMPAVTPSTTYYFAAWSLVGGTWYPGNVLDFTTSPSILPGTLAAQDFGVWNSGGVNGYSAGFKLTDANFTGATVVVKLYSGATLLQTNTTVAGKFDGLTQISSPFDVLGTFNYVSDNYWTNVREAEYGKNLVPTSVVATATLANGKVVTDTNTNLTGDTITIVPLGTLSAQDFGVWNSGGVNGYSAGFKLTDANFTGATSIVVKLYSGNTLLQTDSAITPTTEFTGLTQISSPFDVMGTFNYVTDGYWTNVRGTQYGQTMVPTKVVATVTLANGKVVTAESTNPPTGDLTIISNAGTLAAADFGVVNYDSLGNGILKGYTSGFVLTGATFDGATSVVVKLYSGAAEDTLMQTNTAILTKFNADIKGTQFSSPFDVSGNFAYATDGYWNNVKATQYGQSVPATRVVATVILANGKEVTVENTTPTGESSSTIYPFILTYTAGTNGTITGTTSQAIGSGLNGTVVTAVANSGYHFVNWSDNSSTVATRTDTSVTGNITTTANFAANPSNNGNSGGSSGSYTIPAVPAKVSTPDGCAAGNKFSTTTGRNCNAATPASRGQVLGAEKFNFTLFIKNGSNGSEIIELQKFLNTLGYTLVADGKFGPKTKGAVIKFQITSGLKGDGVVGPLTRAILNK